jgi:hypothetical protein
MTGTYDVIRQAIIDRKQVACVYNGVYRECCPHAIGMKANREHVLMFQFAGGSSTRLPATGQWKCMHVDLINEATAQDGDWQTDNEFPYSRTATCIDILDGDVLSWPETGADLQTAGTVVTS